MAEDILGNQLSGTTAVGLAGVDDFAHGFLANETKAANIFAAAAGDPGSVLAQIYAGMGEMFGDVPSAKGKARGWLDRARVGLGDANEREQMNFALLEAWIGNDVPAALRIGAEIVDRYPRDLVALKLHQGFSFNRGDAPAMLRIALKAMPANPDNPYLLGMAAFGYEECHFLDRAEKLAWKALEIQGKEPWSQHTLAHVMMSEGRVPEGVKFLSGASKTWVGLNSFMYTHNWWHQALFQISMGDEEAVFAAYDRHCWAVDKNYSEDQIGAVSLLARVEMAGFDVGDRWAALSDKLRVRAADVSKPFTSMQYLYGLAKGERAEADVLMAAVEDHAKAVADFEKFAWAEVAVPACRGLLAHARGQYELAVSELSRAMPRMMEIGGSHAQRDLFAQVLLDAHIMAGNFVTAQQLLESRRRFDPNGVPLNRMLAAVYEKLGLMDEAAEASARRYN